MSLLGVFVLLLVGYLCSSNRKAISWRTVGDAFVIQIGLAAFVLVTESGRWVLQWMTDRVQEVILAGFDGIGFVFGGLARVEGNLGFVFAFQVLPVIIFFSSLIAVLYHLRVMQFVIWLVGGALQRLLEPVGPSRFLPLPIFLWAGPKRLW